MGTKVFLQMQNLLHSDLLVNCGGLLSCHTMGAHNMLSGMELITWSKNRKKTEMFKRCSKICLSLVCICDPFILSSYSCVEIRAQQPGSQCSWHWQIKTFYCTILHHGARKSGPLPSNLILYWPQGESKRDRGWTWYHWHHLLSSRWKEKGD